MYIRIFNNPHKLLTHLHRFFVNMTKTPWLTQRTASSYQSLPTCISLLIWKVTAMLTVTSRKLRFLSILTLHLISNRDEQLLVALIRSFVESGDKCLRLNVSPVICILQGKSRTYVGHGSSRLTIFLSIRALYIVSSRVLLRDRCAKKLTVWLSLHPDHMTTSAGLVLVFFVFSSALLAAHALFAAPNKLDMIPPVSPRRISIPVPRRPSEASARRSGPLTVPSVAYYKTLV